MKNIILIIAILTFCSSYGFSQNVKVNEYPEIGKPMVYFELRNVEKYISKNVTNEDLKGKFYILDFGASWCMACFKSYPKINKFQKQFKKQLNFFLVLKEDGKIRNTYKKFEEKQNLDLAVAYDSTLFNKIVPQGVPHYIWVDDKGIVKAITSAMDMNEDNLLAFLQGKPFVFFDRSAETVHKGIANTNIESQTKKTDSLTSNVIYGSIIKKGTAESAQRIPVSLDQSLKMHNQIKIINGFPSNLYELAFTGFSAIHMSVTPEIYKTWYRGWIFETPDSAFFLGQDANTLYNYELVLPKYKNNLEEYKRIMQRDLEECFGYSASVERKEVNVYNLVVVDKKKVEMLKTKGGKKTSDYSYAGFTLTNSPVQGLLNRLSYLKFSRQFFDSTGILENIDITIDALLTDFEEVKKELNRNGLGLMEVKKEMNVIVIRKPVTILKTTNVHN